MNGLNKHLDIFQIHSEFGCCILLLSELVCKSLAGYSTHDASLFLADLERSLGCNDSIMNTRSDEIVINSSLSHHFVG